MKSLAPTKKTWISDDGSIEIEMVSYRTVIIDRLRDQFNQFWDEEQSLPNEMARFVLCVASTTNVRLLVDEPPQWARIIDEVMQDGSWKRQALKVYEALEYAPSDVFTNWFTAYLKTRDDSLLAPEALQDPAPLPPEAYALNGEEDPDKLNFTESATSNGGANLTVMSSAGREKQSVAPTRKAK